MLITSHNDARAPIHARGRESSGGEGEGGKGGMGYEGEILMLAYEDKSLYILVTHIKPAL